MIRISLKGPGWVTIAFALIAGFLVPAFSATEFWVELPASSVWKLERSPIDRKEKMQTKRVGGVLTARANTIVHWREQGGQRQRPFLRHPLKPASWVPGEWVDAKGVHARFTGGWVESRPNGLVLGWQIDVDADENKPDGTWTVRTTPSDDQSSEGAVEDLFASAVSAERTVKARVRSGDVDDRTASAPLQGHPRLLFSQADLPALKKVIQTPLGKQIFLKIQMTLREAHENGFGFQSPGGEHSMHSLWAVGEGLMYQLTGDQTHVERAADWTWVGMFQTLPDNNQWRQSYRILGVALAYDLCADAWSEPFRQNVVHYLFRNATRYSRRDGLMGGLNRGGRFQYGGETATFAHHDAAGRAREYVWAAGLAAMAIEGDDPGFYVPPPLEEIPTIPSAKNFDPVPGVPVCDLEDSQMFSEWIANGPFPMVDEDPLRQIGGFAHARPVPGTEVDVLGVPLEFRMYSPSGGGKRRWPHVYPRNCMKYFTNSTGNGYPSGKKAHKLFKKVGKSAPSALVMYTVWDNRDNRLIQAFPNYFWQSRGARMWLNGVEVKDDDMVKVEPGYYPVMVYLPVTGGYATQAPHLRTVTMREYEDAATRSQTARDANSELQKALREIVESTAVETRWYTVEKMRPNAWHRWGGAEHLWPFVQAWERRTGEFLLKDSPLLTTVDFAPFLAGRIESGSVLRHAYLAAPFLNNDAARVVYGMQEKKGLGFRRPTLGLTLLTSMLKDRAPSQNPSAHSIAREDLFLLHPAAELNERNGMVAIKGLHDVDRDTAFDAMGFHLSGFRHDRRGHLAWVRSVGDTEEDARLLASIPRIYKHRARGPVEVVHINVDDLGNGSTTLLSAPIVPTNAVAKVEGKKEKAIRIQRAFFTDSAQAEGKGVTVVVADTFMNVTRNEAKIVQFHLGQEIKKTNYVPKTQILTAESRNRETGGASAMRAHFFAPRALSKQVEMIDNNRGTLRLILDKPKSDKEKLRNNSRRSNLAGESDELVLDFGDEILRDQQAGAPETVTIVKVINLRDGSAKNLPAVSWSAPNLKIGLLKLRLDEKGWVRQ